MNTGILKKTKKRSHRSKEFIGEKINREGQWTRAFDVRAESWFTFENWAHENHYHMIACKAHRRLYSKGINPNYYTTFVDIRHDANRVVLSSWIQVGFKLRALSFFLLPEILPISPIGFRGIRTRRSACHHLNSILERFKQPAIHQSEGLHIADMELSSLMLLGKMALAVVGFTTLLATRIEVSPGLSNFLMNELFKRVMLLSVVGGILFSIHHFGLARRTIESWKKMASAGAVSLVFTALAILMLTKTSTEDLEAKVNHHCLLHLNVKKCAVALENLPEKTRENLLSRLQSFSKEIAIKK
ncbi:MAG: hypothetical protein NT000_01655 [Proteobacteria bacterium]|nr:hypothetical protein [Pseudomonadota bacterium]